jgi:DNA repair exonuclease SbcCD nuclease subunit
MTLAHTADWHWEAEKLEKCRASADFIISKLREIKPDLHVIAGDYWNRRQMLTSASAFRPAIEALTRMAEICPIVVIKGNNEHDAEGSVEWLSDLETVHPIYATERAGTILFHRDDASHPEFPTLHPFESEATDHAFEFADAVLHLFPYPTKQHFLADKPGLSIDESNLQIQDEIRKIMLGFGAISADAKCPVILVGHGQIGGSRKSSGQQILGQDIILSKHDLALAGADVQCWGHIHEEQWFDVPSFGPIIFYSGSTYHKDWGETTPRRFLVHEVERGSLKTTTVTIPSRGLSLHECVFDSEYHALRDQNPEEEWEDWHECIMRVRVHRTKEQVALITDEMVKAKYPGAFQYDIEYITTPEERIRSSEIVKARSLREKMVEWSKSIEKELPAEVLELADETERGCAT